MSLQTRNISLKALLYIFAAMDIGVFLTFNWIFIGIVIAPQLSAIFAYRAGMRREGMIKACLGDLTTIVTNKKLTDEEMFHRFIMSLNHWNIEFGFFMENLNRKYGFAFTKKPPYTTNNNIKNKKKKVIKKTMTVQLTEEKIKSILYWVAGVWLFFLPAMFDFLWMSGLKLVWVIFLTGALGFADFMFFWYLWHFWGIKREDVTPQNPIPTDEPFIPGVTDTAASYYVTDDPDEGS